MKLILLKHILKDFQTDDLITYQINDVMMDMIMVKAIQKTIQRIDKYD